MNTLRISLLGGVTITNNKESCTTSLTRVTQTLLSYLVLYRHRFHPREVLASLLWGDQPDERARNCLNTALWRLRNVLEPSSIERGSYLVTNPSGEIGFNHASDYWLDLAILEEEANRILTRPVHLLNVEHIVRVEAALQLYQGDLMEGFYEDWVLRERERVRDLYLHCLAHLMGFYSEQKMIGKAIDYGQQILRLDPLHEEIHRALMRLYVQNGQRTLAIRQYESCMRLLEQELSVAPMEETQALLTQIASDLPALPLPASSRPELPPIATVDQTVMQLQRVIEHFAAAQRELLQAQEMVKWIRQSND